MTPKNTRLYNRFPTVSASTRELFLAWVKAMGCDPSAHALCTVTSVGKTESILSLRIGCSCGETMLVDAHALRFKTIVAGRQIEMMPRVAYELFRNRGIPDDGIQAEWGNVVERE